MADTKTFTSKMVEGADDRAPIIFIHHSDLSVPFSDYEYQTCVDAFSSNSIYLIYSSGGIWSARLNKITTGGELLFSAIADNLVTSISVIPGATHTITKTVYTLS